MYTTLTSKLIFNQTLPHVTLIQQRARDLQPLSVGDVVIAKHKNTRYYTAEVLDTRDQVFYAVDFDDGSFSNDLFPADIHVSSFYIYDLTKKNIFSFLQC